MYKKVYIEITNHCNLNCDFCIKNDRTQKFMSQDEFQIILDKLKPYTRYLYFHVLGEPLLHPNINDFINLASKEFKVNLTTNGYLIKRLRKATMLRQINISLHSFDEKYNIKLEDYLNDIFDVADSLNKNTFISYRLWTKCKHSKEFIMLLNKKYSTNIDIDNPKDNTKLATNIYLSLNDEFTWPNLNNEFIFESGFCPALKHHLGVLVDGTVIPCCLDSKGTINLGNIFVNTMEEIINSDRYQRIIKGFENNKKVELLCKKCPINHNIKTFYKTK
ncbi:MAG: radical SAM protein [Firmicutes bacterium]|nr:radical SAM protein [Bacillota bacterium]